MRSKLKRRRSLGRGCLVQALEKRVMLTGFTTPYGGFTPAQIEAAYGESNISFNGTAGTGAGETIAILYAGDDRGLVNSTAANFSTSDLAKFRQDGIHKPG